MLLGTKSLLLCTKIVECKGYNPDNVFKRFQMIEFPISFVGLSTTKQLDVEVDLDATAYLKTMCDNNLRIFKDAREISAAHRAFDISRVDHHTIAITFSPKNECISKVKHNKQFDNRFVFDLRLIQADGIRCCNNEFHSEIGRYYICGEFEYCNITHYPTTINFGDVVMNSQVTKYIRIRNESNVITAKMKYVRVPCFEIKPQFFSIPPNSSRRLSITIKPTCLKVGNKVTFQIRNPHDVFDESTKDDNNFLTIGIDLEVHVIYHKGPKELTVESMHKLSEKNPKYTYVGKELTTHIKRKEIACKNLEIAKSLHAKKPIIEKFSTGKTTCMVDDYKEIRKGDPEFCKIKPDKINTYGLLNILLLPVLIDFGRVGLSTYGESELTIKNNSRYDVLVHLSRDNCVLYTHEKLSNMFIKLKAFSETILTIFCLGFMEGNFEGTFEYTLDKKFQRKHPYTLQVGSPRLMILEKSCKFGMVSTDSFVTSVPVRIYNHFNVSVGFHWNELQPDTPFEINPSSGIIPKHSCKICDVTYVCKATKTKTHEVDLITETKKTITIELSIITRKLSIKFLQPAVFFKDIALNIETIERVKLENSSREIALFHVVEPLIPGLRIEPMSGTIRPKMLMTFEIIVKISCILEFAFDIYVKINNKENIVLPISGNVVEPKLIIHPKNIYMARIPCNMITYVPVTFQNISTLKTYVEVLDTGDENIFNVYIAQGNEKIRIFEFDLEGGQSKTVFIKVFDIFRREYEMFIPFKINGLLGPPDFNSWSTELQHYIGEYEQSYENNPKVKLKTLNKDITYCRMAGVITVPWIQFSVENFEIDFVPQQSNSLEFTMTNVSKYYLYITILTSKLSPSFTLDLQSTESQTIINETNIKFELDRQKEASFFLKFHPKGHGKFISTALLYLDKHMTIPYSNLTFIGKRQTPPLIASTYRLIFPPCRVGETVCRIITLKFKGRSNKNGFSFLKDEKYMNIEFQDCTSFQDGEQIYTTITAEIEICCPITYSRNMTLSFNHECGSGCDIEVFFCFTYCPLTLHTTYFVDIIHNPYPYYPLSTETDLYDYLEICTKFLEKWMFQQGFRRDLYPVIPDTFHTISSAITSQPAGTKSKGINVSYLNFVRRIAGPLMKHVRKISVQGVDESFKYIKEIHDTYKEIINLIRCRGGDLWLLQAKFLLSYDQFVIYAEYVTPKCNADIILTRELLADANLFNRLNKQSWIDFILQSYKVFIMDSCFFDCVCVSAQPRDIIKVIIDWYNEQIAIQHDTLRGKEKPIKVVTNLTSDLSDGIAMASAILSYCPFMAENFLIFYEVNENDEGGIIHNACLIIEAMNILRLYFPLCSRDFLEPNFIQMLFLSIHLYVVLPMFKPKAIIKFNPPLLRSSTRQVSIAPSSQESLIFSFILLNNTRNNFIVEKSASGENGKKMFLNIKFIANFTDEETSILLVHGYNKTRIFDTYMIFLLNGSIGALNPVKKCKVTGPLYRPNKVDVLVSSPFTIAATFRIYLTDVEPVIPVKFDEVSEHMPKFYLRRLNIIDNEINLNALPKDSGQDVQEQKLYLQLICLSTQIGNTWVWFRSGIGEFVIKVTTQPRWDLAIDTLQARVRSWPMDPCSCGEACECYRTTVLVIPHRNELMLKSLRYSLMEHASEAMMHIYDTLIETPTGMIILGMLLAEGGTNMSEVQHILRTETSFRITSRALLPRLDHARLAQHSGAILALPVTLPARDKSEKYSVTFTSDCGMDIRTYRILFIETDDG